MKEKKAATAAAPTDATRKAAVAEAPAPNRPGGDSPRKRTRDDNGDGDLPSHVDLISKLPDDILGTVISLLPTKDGARTQAIARRWRPLWRSAPLNLKAADICLDVFKRFSIVSRILSDHHGPARRFVFNSICLHKKNKKFRKESAWIERWFHSRALDSLQELNISFKPLDYTPGSEKHYPLPPSVFRSASTLVVAQISRCDFPKEIPTSPSFPLLKQLKLMKVSISEDVFHGVLFGCHVLESLSLESIADVGCFRISSPTLRSVGLCTCFSGKGELVIEDTPRLERLLLSRLKKGHQTIRVIRAPKLEILGPLSPRISEIEIANQVFQCLVATSLRSTISTVKVLALGFSVPDLNAVINVLRWFPCLEKLYVTWSIYFRTPMQNGREYDPLDLVKCLETNLKKLVLVHYEGSEQYVAFAKFFILNTKVLKEIKFRVSKEINKEWVSDQYRLLEVGTRASPDAQLEFIHSKEKRLDAHDLSNADPFTCYILNEVDALSE